MNVGLKTFFFILLVLKAIVLTRTQLSYEHDVTKQLDNWIAKLFKINTETIRKLFGKISAESLQNFSYDNDGKIPCFAKKFIFRDVRMNMSEFKSPQIHWKFSENKMGIFLKQFTVQMLGKIFASNLEDSITFNTFLSLVNVSFTMNINADNNTTHRITADHFYLWQNDDDDEKVEVYDIAYDLSVLNHKSELEEELLPATFAVLREHFSKDKNFDISLRNFFGVYYSDNKKALVNMYPDFLTSQDKYYYLIPKISFFRFNLKNIIIRGLSNFEWIKINTGISTFTHTLMIRNIHGSLVLDYGISQEKPVQLKFNIDYFSVSIDKKSVNVDARCFSVNKTNTPLPYRQSALLMQRIELAIAGSLFPTMQIHRMYDIDTPLEQIRITEKSDWKSIKKSLQEWIPFNDDETKPFSGAQIKP